MNCVCVGRASSPAIGNLGGGMIMNWSRWISVKKYLNGGYRIDRGRGNSMSLIAKIKQIIYSKLGEGLIN